MASWKAAEPASSLLAAQLDPHDQTQRLSRETFSQLRQELVDRRYSQLHFDDSDTDVNKLICIVLRAGLDPFQDARQSREDLEGQTLDCLDIVQAAAEKAPQALTQVSDPGILGETLHAPLFAWLGVRLLGLVGAWDSGSVRDAVFGTVSTIAHSQSRQGRSMPFCHSISMFLRACTLGL
jgi:serine/threonine-protein kinase ATR